MLPMLIPAAIALASEVFPLLVTKIAGKNAGEVAGKVLGAAADVVGLPADTPPAEIIDKVRGDPIAREKLRYEFELLNQQEHERILNDRQDARKYQMQLGEMGRKRGDWMLIGALMVLLACIGGVFFVGSTETDAQAMTAQIALLTTISGVALKMISDAFAFEFGSSRGSKEKDVVITEFKEALMAAGKERQNTVETVIKAQQRSLQDTQETLRKSVAVQKADEMLERVVGEAREERRRRDFVAELMEGMG